jgi:hypothetical protein
MSDTREAREALVRRILEGPGKASSAERRAAFNNSGLAGLVGALVDKVARHGVQLARETGAYVSAPGALAVVRRLSTSAHRSSSTSIPELLEA